MIGVIAGKGNLPKVLINKLIQKKIKFILINIGFKAKINNISNNFKITEIFNIIDFLNSNHCKKVILVGKVNRPSLKDLKFDYKILKLLPEILINLKKGDSFLLDLVIKILKKNKIEVVSCLKYIPEITADNFLSKTKPSKDDILDIKKGKSLLEHINSKFDVGQSVVVNKGFVVGIEGAEGTDLMLRKITKIQKKINNGKLSGVLVKIPKKIQDIRVDIPTIGINTIKNCINAGIKGIALKRNENIFLDQNKCNELIKKNKFFIKVIN